MTRNFSYDKPHPPADSKPSLLLSSFQSAYRKRGTEGVWYRVFLLALLIVIAVPVLLIGMYFVYDMTLRVLFGRGAGPKHALRGMGYVRQNPSLLRLT